MPFHGFGHHSRSHSHTGSTPEVPQQPLASLVVASQSLSGVGNPAAIAAPNPAGQTQKATTVSNNQGRNKNVGGSSAASSSKSGGSPQKKSIAFQLPSPNPASSENHPPQAAPTGSSQQQRSSQRHQEGVRSPQEVHSSSSTSLQLPPSLQRRPTDPGQAQQPSSNTGSRPHISAINTGLGAVPQTQPRPPMHRTNPGYSPNPTLDTSGSSSASARKYPPPGTLTPTYPTSSQHTTSHSSGAAYLGNIGLSGLNSSTTSVRDREENMGGIGAVGPGRWMSPYSLYALDWCKWPTSNGYGRIAIGSYAEDSHNYIQVLDTRPGPADPQQSNAHTLEFTKLAEASHTYPITRVLWEPPSSKPLTELIATSGDHLRLWSLPPPSNSTSPSNSITSRNYQQPTQKLTPLALLSNSKSTDFTAPLTSLDWNQISPSLIITSSIDTTCTIWDIPTLTAKTQLIAHDKEVFDVRFMSNSVDVFASCGADGSVRMFDLRSLEHSTIIYEPGGNKTPSSSTASDREGGSPVNNNAPPALLRLAASPHEQHLIATFCVDSPVVRILDVRQPGQALVELKGHDAPVNCCEWNPGRRGVLAAGGDDCEVLAWDILGSGGNSVTSGGKPEKGVEQERNPIAWWSSEVEVNNLSWSPSQTKTGSDWLGVVGGRGVWGIGV